MVHAGVLPGWTTLQTLQLAREVTEVLRGPEMPDFMQSLYGNTPDHWRDNLTGHDRWRTVVNALTRLRFCTPEGVMEFETKEAAGAAPAGFLPWFDVPGRRTAGTTVAFGHWSTLKKVNQPNVVCLDDGCVWGGCLSALSIEDAETVDDVRQLPVLSVKCQPALDPLA